MPASFSRSIEFRGTLFSLILFGTAWASIALAQRTNGVSPLWLANGFGVALLLLGRTALLRMTMPIAFLAITTANLFAHSALGPAVSMAAVNVAEITVIYLAMRHWRIRPSQPAGLLTFIGLATVCAACSALAASTLLALLSGAEIRSVLPVWFSADLLGLLITIPPILGVDRGEFGSLLRGKRVATALACLLVAFVTSAGVFVQHPYPLLFLILPVLILSTYLLGSPGATITNVLVAVVSIAMTSAGSGPIAERVIDPQARMALVQLFLAVNLLVTFLVASVIKQRQRLIQALSEREGRARRLAENAPAAIVRIGIDGRIDFANSRFAALVNREQSTLSGQAFDALLGEVGPASSPEWSRPLGTEAVSVDLTFSRPDAAPRHAVLTATAEYDANDERTGWIALVVDVSEQREAQFQLEESERSHRLLAEHGHDMIVRIGLDGVRRYISPACRQVLGYEPEELLGATPVGAIHPDDRARVADVVRTLLAGAVDPIATYRQHHKDGHYVWLEAVYRLVVDPESGAPAEFIASVRDISRRHDAEHAATEAAAKLHEANRLLIMAEKLARVGHWRVDTVNDTLFWSDEVYVIHGVPPTFSPSLTQAIDVYHPDDRERVGTAVSRCIGDGEPFDFEARINRPDGEQRWISTSGQAERAPNGEIVGAVGVFQDVTDRVQTNRELVDARELAEAALEAQSVFTATLSHEIRTPLTGVLAAAELLQDARSPEERQRYLQTLRHSADLLSSIINDVLVFAKLDQGEVAVDAEPFDPVELTAQVAAAFESAAEAKGLVVAVKNVGDGGIVVGDPTRIQRVLANLISNALKFTERGGVEVRVMAVGDGADPRWRFEVADTGAGIPPDKLHAIFEPFVQADASTTRNHGGTGLGLAICRLLVRAMGGEITVTSNGAGSRFTFELPLAFAATISDAAGDDAPGSPVPASSILLAEDNATNRYLLTVMLERQGHEVLAVENGLLALLAVRAKLDRPFDLILMDVQMPVMDGVAATREIRILPEPARSTPICAVTAEDSRQRRLQFIEAGMDEVLAKPIRPDQLAHVLRAFCGTDGVSPVYPAVEPACEVVVGLFDQARLDGMEATLGRAGRDQLLDILIQDAARLPGMIRDRLASGQTSQAALEAHSLKGTAAVVGAAELSDAVRAFEVALAGSEPLDGPLLRLEAAAKAVEAEGSRLRQEARA